MPTVKERRINIEIKDSINVKPDNFETLVFSFILFFILSLKNTPVNCYVRRTVFVCLVTTC